MTAATSHAFESGDTDYVENLNAVRTDVGNSVDKVNGLDSDLTGNSTHKLIDMADGSEDQDYATMANLASEILSGGDPGSISITDLGVGTATAGQAIVVNESGSALIGVGNIPAALRIYAQAALGGL